MQFWKDYIYDCIKNHAWDWGYVTKGHMNAILKNTLRGSAMTAKDLPKMRRLQIPAKL
jgi:hypothetical protein